MSKKTVTLSAVGGQGAGKTLVLDLLAHVLRSHDIETTRSGHVIAITLDERDREVIALANRKAGQ